MARKERIDILLVEQGLAESRSLAQRLVMAGQVRVDGQLVHKPSRRIEAGAQIQVDSGPRFVSRGGEKLEAALEAFPVSVENRVCADVGASTGGFTDCLLQSGAARVYAIDVGYGLLHWRLRNHPRVVVMERTNARKLQALPEGIDLVTIDASFISLCLLLPAVVGWLVEEGEIIALVKPQFEAGKGAVGKGGVVRDPEVHRSVLLDVMACANDLDLGCAGVMRSPLLGPKGNVEFLLWCTRGATSMAPEELVEDLFPSVS
jgi:23S rRNA (cytidine1920-2'-O)/16S rRNA (cytidine1409-2'-O)-methyltransferase